MLSLFAKKKVEQAVWAGSKLSNQFVSSLGVPNEANKQ
jgi:hypothetical protein